MTTPRNARTAALEALIDAHAIELKLPTVRRRFRALADEAVREQQDAGLLPRGAVGGGDDRTR